MMTGNRAPVMFGGAVPLTEEESEDPNEEGPWLVPDAGEVSLGRLLSETCAEDVCVSVERVT